MYNYIYIYIYLQTKVNIVSTVKNRKRYFCETSLAAHELLLLCYINIQIMQLKFKSFIPYRSNGVPTPLAALITKQLLVLKIATNKGAAGKRGGCHNYVTEMEQVIILEVSYQ